VSNIAYTTSKITAVPRLICKTPLSETAVAPRDAWNAAGISSDEMANASNDDAVWAVSHYSLQTKGYTVMLNSCSLYFRPPKKKHIPRTSNRFDNIDPRSEAWTIRVFP
jgi:hypothetical protein